MDYLLEQSIKICLICMVFLPSRILVSSYFLIRMRERDGNGTIQSQRRLCEKHMMSNWKPWGQKTKRKQRDVASERVKCQEKTQRKHICRMCEAVCNYLRPVHEVQPDFKQFPLLCTVRINKVGRSADESLFLQIH